MSLLVTNTTDQSQTPSLTAPPLFSAMLSFLTCLVDSFDIHFIGHVDRSPVISRVTGEEADMVGGEDLVLFVPRVQLPSS